jgi:hypothetical protein
MLSELRNAPATAAAEESAVAISSAAPVATLEEAERQRMPRKFILFSDRPGRCWRRWIVF